MKKIIFLIMTLFIVGCGINTSKISEIEIVNTENSEKSVVTNDNDTGKLVIEAINKKDKTNEDISSLFSFEIYIKRDSDSEGYIMSFDIKNKKVFISKDDNVYKVRDKVAKSLLVDENFNFIYVKDSINKVYVYKNDGLVLPAIQYEWNFKDSEGSIKSKSGMLSDENQNVAVSDKDKIQIRYDVDPDSQVTKVYRGGEVIYTGKDIAEAINSIKNDGEYFIETEIRWNKKNGSDSSGKQVISFVASIDRPPDFTVISKENYPGNILIVAVDNLNEDETVKIETDAVKTETDIYPYNGRNIAILPIDLNVKEGEYAIRAVYNENKSNSYEAEKKFNIKNKDFKTQYLTVSEELNSSNNDDKAIQEFVEYVKPARVKSSAKKLWEGEFIMPVEGRLTTDFAEIRYVNNDRSSSRHSGIDIAAPTGTEIKAPNNGRVVLAMKDLLSTGNTLVIDHGMGLFTSYYHLDTILVDEGSEVKKGDIVGTVGTTGFSTGPHLHYAVSIYNTYVNTYQPLSGIFD